MGDEIHIASLVVNSSPDRVNTTSRLIAGLPGAQVHAATPNGKLVVTLEAASGDEVLSAVNLIQKTEGVLSAALVYQYADSREAMLEEIPEGTR